jgi:3'-phosphoadenosine 5'-phosphosulfate sulfotransferase (PAPS reductase)/FAD synthetase
MTVKPNTSELLPLSDYDRIIVAVSGGKDSLAATLDLVDRGVDPSKVELWHHGIDGEHVQGKGLMDWPITPAYSLAVANHLGLRHLTQYRDGGFEAEMNRDNAPTGDVLFETLDGEFVRLPSQKHRRGTRGKFPQVSADLSVRWCSAYLKIDVASRVLSNDPRFKSGQFLLITGERRQESAARAKYAEVEKHRCSGKKRRVDQWRSVVAWSEEQVWEKIKQHKINPHPAYHLGWGRVSCLACIFGDRNQWASVKEIAPRRFYQISQYEQNFGLTIKRNESVKQQAEKGQEHVTDKPLELRRLAMSYEYPQDQITVDPWTVPVGAFKKCGGPT